MKLSILMRLQSDDLRDLIGIRAAVLSKRAVIGMQVVWLWHL